MAYAKANQAKLQYGSAGGGSGAHVCALLLDAAMGTKITHVPYRGAGPAMQDLIGGRLDYMAEQISTAFPQIEGGAVKAIIMLGPDRVSVLPKSAVREGVRPRRFRLRRLGRAGAAAARADAIVRKLNKAAGEAIDTPSVQKRLAAVGVSIIPRGSPQPRISRQVHPGRDQEMGGADQGERRQRGVRCAH